MPLALQKVLWKGFAWQVCLGSAPEPFPFLSTTWGSQKQWFESRGWGGGQTSARVAPRLPMSDDEHEFENSEDEGMQWLDAMGIAAEQAAANIAAPVVETAALLEPPCAQPAKFERPEEPPHAREFPALDRHEFWSRPIVEALKAVADARGEQLFPVHIMSLASATCSEAHGPRQVGVQIIIPYTCDPKIESHNWICDNGPFERECHFKDMREIAASGRGWCHVHARVCRTNITGTVKHKTVFSGLSCRGFSTSNQNRGKGTRSHAEGLLYEDFITIMIKEDCDDAWFENVCGILLRESSSDLKSPLQRMIEMANERAPQYAILVLFMDGAGFNLLSRRRVWCHFCHRRVGGVTAQRRLQNYVKVSRLKIG